MALHHGSYSDSDLCKQQPSEHHQAPSLDVSLPLRRATGLSEQEFSALHNGCKRGDLVGVRGHPGKSKKGELSVFPATFVVLAPCLHMLPRQPPKRRDEQGHEFQPVGMNQVRGADNRLRQGGAALPAQAAPAALQADKPAGPQARPLGLRMQELCKCCHDPFSDIAEVLQRH